MIVYGPNEDSLGRLSVIFEVDQHATRMAQCGHWCTNTYTNQCCICGAMHYKMRVCDLHTMAALPNALPNRYPDDMNHKTALRLGIFKYYGIHD